MDAKHRYHRSYLSYYKYIGTNQCKTRCHKPSNRARNSGSDYDFDSLRGRDFPGPKAGGTDSPFDRPLPRVQDLTPKPVAHDPERQLSFKAYKVTGKTLSVTKIVEKTDQEFKKYATSWERQHSKLLHRLASKQSVGAIPVVDETNMVVGHIARVSGRRLFVPQALHSITRHAHQYLEEDIPMFVGTERLAEWDYMDASEVIYDVLTGVDGEVLMILHKEFIGIESSEFWLLDVIELALGVVGVGIALGKILVRSLVRRAARRSGRIVIREITGMTAKRARQAVAQQTARKTTKALPPARHIPESGLTQTHFGHFRSAASEENVIAVVRNTNRQSTRLIDLGCPGKQLEIKITTSSRTGVVTATSQQEIELLEKLGHYVVERDGKARKRLPGIGKDGNPNYDELDLKGAFWQVEPGQAIHGKLKKPIVGDYDLMAVIDPENMGQNIAVHVSNGAKRKNVSSPIVDRFAKNVNAKMDQDRVLHGAHDQFAGYRGGATVFHPNGDVVFLKTESDVKAFYQKMRRRTQREKYPRPSDSTPVEDQLAKMRAKKAKVNR